MGQGLTFSETQGPLELSETHGPMAPQTFSSLDVYTDREDTTLTQLAQQLMLDLARIHVFCVQEKKKKNQYHHFFKQNNDAHSDSLP